MSQPLSCEITSPADGSQTNDRTPTVTGTTDNEVAVDLREGTTSLATGTSSGAGAFTLTPGSNLAYGAHTLYVRAGTNPDTLDSDPITIHVTQVPQITTPAENATVTDAPYTITGTAAPDSLVAFDGGPVFTYPVGADGSGDWELEVTRTPGQVDVNRLRTRAILEDGTVTAQSDWRTWTHDPDPLEVDVDVDDDEVTITVANAKVPTMDVDFHNGDYLSNWPVLEPIVRTYPVGEHEVTVTAGTQTVTEEFEIEA